MDNKDKVRQRRLDKIRKLQESTANQERLTNKPVELPSAYTDLQPASPNSVRHESAYDPRWDDPEFVWKQKMERELRQPVVYPPQYTGSGSRPPHNEDDRMRVPFGVRFLRQLMASAALFGLVWGMFQLQHPLLERGKGLVTAALTEPMDFQRLSAWYSEMFDGAPSFIPAFHSEDDNPAIKASSSKRSLFAPVQGTIKLPYSDQHQALVVTADPGTPVNALDAGQIIFAGSREDTGYTVIIRHPGGLQSEYGQIEQSRVEVNDWIKGGETIGQVSRDAKSGKGFLYFAIQKNNGYVNPADVISIE
ncbi:M23 family metallopeptidase [Paenibacillus lutrae]|uniref:Peptidoglycan DD-metalloendopeptidase family protein n=1 Tax=Paenibacillus lutrae TaxID=2078573 RepID=A0A7X3JZ42_9BACL|nr:M23 family metallopeptidase [Paenibacillus lutrae]MVO99677.1 peptidoglycan DD-metalloendopeptidase family protein [Paenibacillus lutrae]